ncbi:HEAT repeat domain-containing protein [Streptomyces sp. DSM 40750]|uniref:HEAT repeat domain-containing protein n=1 Tax=Streptomyces sp. DSM 40750 TaxID=2801030 RepID=UPI00214C6C58|nr:HEAT repeat domain-containing protein [Streptomyces sp. DSM 40750]UUU24642.1 HEAT repeat domain-containing protein [Streptomyces sp. DSM 40750]
MIPAGLLSGALLCLPAVVMALSLLVVGSRCVRGYRQRRRERIAAPVRGVLLHLLCADEDEQSGLLHRLAEIDKRTWTALEPTLTALLGKVAGTARTALVRLCELRGAAVAAVADLSSRSAARRGRAAQVLGQLCHRPAAQALCRLLADRDPEVRLAAARALGRCGGPAAVPYLLESLHGARTVSPDVVTGALVFLGPEAQRGVVAGLEHPQPLVRAVAIEVLGTTGAVSQTPGITRALGEDPAVEVRIKAARALGGLGMPDGLEPLLAAVGPGRPVALRIVGAGALGRLGAAAATPRLAELLGDPDPHVAATAARALLRLGPAGRAALRTAADERPGGPAAAQARAALAESEVGGARHDVRVEVTL